MPRRLVLPDHLPDHLPRAERERRYRSAHAPVARSHGQILWLLVRGDRTADVADVTGYSTTWVRDVAKRYRAGGPDALGDRRPGNPGRSDRALLTSALRDALRQSLGGPAPDGGIWTGPKVAQWLSERRGRPVRSPRGWDALRTLGFTPQRPRPRATRADPVAQEAFEKGASRPPSMP